MIIRQLRDIRRALRRGEPPPPSSLSVRPRMVDGKPQGWEYRSRSGAWVQVVA